MAQALVRNESPTEYFRELVESTTKRQHPAARELNVVLSGESAHRVRARGSVERDDRGRSASGEGRVVQ